MIASCCSGVNFSKKFICPFACVSVDSMISVVLSVLEMALLAILSMSKLNSWLIRSPFDGYSSVLGSFLLKILKLISKSRRSASLS